MSLFLTFDLYCCCQCLEEGQCRDLYLGCQGVVVEVGSRVWFSMELMSSSVGLKMVVAWRVVVVVYCWFGRRSEEEKLCGGGGGVGERR